MKNRLLTISIREIKKSKKRFLSLLIMSFLGVAMFVGIKNCPGTMLKTIDTYYDKSSLYDIKLISSLGFSEEDIKALKEIGTIPYGSHSKDVLMNFKKDTQVTKLIGLTNNINKIILNEGTLPQKENEIVVEKNLLTKEKLKIGDYLTIEEDSTLKTNQFKIVGVVTSPLYLFIGGNSITRGNTNIGNGKIEYYAYVQDNLFDMDYYTEIYINVPNNYITSKKDYIDLINKKLKLIESIKKERESKRYQEVIHQYQKEINDKELEGKNELNNAEIKLNQAKEELNNGYQKLLSSKKQLDQSKNTLDETLNTLNNSKTELEQNEKLLQEGKKELLEKENEINEALKSYGLTLEDIITIKEILNDKVVSKESLKHLFSNSIYKEQIEKIIDELFDTDFITYLISETETKEEKIKELLINSIPKEIDHYDEIIKEIESFNKDTLREAIYQSILESAYQIEDIKKYINEDLPYYNKIITLLDNYADTILKLKELFDGIDKLTQGKEEILKNELLLQDGKRQLEQGYQTYYHYINLYEDGLNQYKVGYLDYQKGLNTYQSGLEEYLKNKKIFEENIQNAKDNLEEIEPTTWYIYDRSNDSEYSGYLNNTESIQNLSKAFPTIFYLVAVFMCVMSMSRMALEDRQEIGTLKSLGFSNKHIILKYIIYSSLATILGSILGGLFGFYFLNWFIFTMYKILYKIPYFEYQYDIKPFMIGFLISVICITGTTLLTINKIVKEKPSNLLRPLTPNKGKKILLEYLPFWKNISFSNKITIRNIIRYKKRVIMTILGINGCTILLLTGYGIKDSITSIADKQFNDIFQFDDIIYLDHKVKDIETILNKKDIKSYEEVYLQTVKVNDFTTDLYVLGKDYNSKVINIMDYKTHKKLYLEDHKVIITEKLSTEHHYHIGDKINFIDSNNKIYEVEISGIATNYVGAYIYMNRDYYEELFEEYIPNIIYLNLNDTKKEESMIKKLMENEHVLSIVRKKTALKNIESMLESLDNVVLVLLVLSGMLSFVVLYNLSYINISERKREIATLKVLGFTHYEVDNYIIKENFIITIIGILLGLIVSKPFVDYIVDSIEIELVRFIHLIKMSSYIETFLFMILFTCIVTIIIHHTLKKIDMIESLKTVE